MPIYNLSSQLYGLPWQAMQGMAERAGPFWQWKVKAPYVQEAYDIAKQFVAPGFGELSSADEWGDVLRGVLGRMLGSEHPGMGEAEYGEALRNIAKNIQQQKAQAAGVLGGAGASVDPAVLASLAAQVGALGSSALGQLAAQRAGLDRQTLMDIARVVQPLVGTNLDALREYSRELRSMAGNIMESGYGFNNPWMQTYNLSPFANRVSYPTGAGRW